MAIDTAEKRRAVAGISAALSVAVTPNVAKDVQWRQESGWGYPGIFPSLPSDVPENPHRFRSNSLNRRGP